MWTGAAKGHRRVWSAGLRCLFVLIALLGADAIGSTALGQNKGDEKALALRPNVVKITATLGRSMAPQSGFGFIVGQQGNQLVVITADHVVRGDDPGAEDKAPLITFFENQGTQLPGKLESVRLQRDRGDLAVILVQNPGFVSFVRDAVDPMPAARFLQVWLVGRAGTWDVPASPGVGAQVDPFSKMIKVEGLAARVGSSGGPLISSNGIVGMIVMDNELYTEATPIEPIQIQVRDRWRYPWLLTAARPISSAPQTASRPEVTPPAPHSARPPPLPQSAYLCGQSVEHMVDRAATSAEYAGFLGIWTGNWNSNRLCGALIVERVRPDGSADVIYAYGSNRAGGASHQQRRPALIDAAGRLRFQDDQGSTFVFTRRSDDLLNASFSGASGRLTTSFGRYR